MRIFNRVQFVIRNLSSVTTATAAPLPFWKVPLGSWLSSSSGLLKGLAPIRGVHDQRKKGDEELLGFVEEEIVTKLKVQRSTPIPSTLQGFMLEVDKSEITLTKKVGNEE
ncbi:Complement component 1 Q subcomponent-binding protein, mitochondrial [Orchesella cincta]|uniref:Complement component 1 Q subcomponent-binding protein, mitochondrial n=1 Tax=Orchesella cincta TaxID=48709 RepID=A0A1D2M658_ORCCI|nr:Complement component 1 Q subcomponent-binding protein, mitochondrial [Orchesella cincta]